MAKMTGVMMQNPIEFTNVWKKFRKGEKFNSLRDAIPNLFRKRTAKNVKDITLEDMEFWAVKDVNFNVKKGEVVGVIGPNGAGKSTILKLLSGIIVPNKGSMKVTGRLSALIEVTAGFHPELTGRENVYLNGTILGMKRKEISEKFDEIVEFSGISEFIDTPVKRYSSGMYSRLGFSVAAHVNPDVLLVDEVLAVGDIAFQAKCAEKMRELLRSGVTIVLVSHNIALIENLCSRVILLGRGEVLKEGAPEKVIPYYENLVFQQQENELKQKLKSSDYKVKVPDDLAVDISNVILLGENNEGKDSFCAGENFTVKAEYKTQKKIENPVFALEIIRADGVLCCSSNTKEKSDLGDSIEGKGGFKINLGKLDLCPGIYAAKVSIWDRDMIHPYVIRKDNVFRIEVSGVKNADGVFLKDMDWQVTGA